MPARSHNLIRVLVGTGLTAAIVAAIAVPTPEVLPAVAVGQAAIYRSVAEARFDELKNTVNALKEGHLTASHEIKRLKEGRGLDNTQPEVDSQR
ncbi:MAG: hypothetical protein ACJ76B_09905 [Solirubrobacterales bacterium]